jgi:hypothetical protein
MKDSMESINLINQAMALVHPAQFSLSLAARDELRKMPLTKALASQWESIFTAISLIINRTTVVHRDSRSDQAWYDFLLTLGSYRYAEMELRELGLRLSYTPGTAVAFCANVFEHSVAGWGPGDRICYAFFNRKVVLERFGENKAGWMTENIFKTGHV